MSWLVRGSGKKPNDLDAMVFEREGQYLVDVQRLMTEAIQLGCTEIFIIKKGGRDGAKKEDREVYLGRVRGSSANDSWSVEP